MSGDNAVTTGTYWNREQMSRFWEQLPDKLRVCTIVKREIRVIVTCGTYDIECFGKAASRYAIV